MTHHHHIDLGEIWLRNPAQMLPNIEAFKSVAINIASPVESGYFTAIIAPGRAPRFPTAISSSW